MKFGGDVLQMLTCLMVQPVCLWLFWVMSKKNEKTRLVSPGCMIFLSQVEKIFWVAQNFVYDHLPMFLRAFCS